MLILRSLIAVLSCAAMSVAVAAQNLVPNPSFEESSECPKTLTDFAKAVPWFVASGSTDYFHACANADTPLIVGVPQNFKGYQAARTGVGYGGFYLFYSHIRHSNFKKREYMETKLLDSLKKGEQYRVEFYVSLADSSTWAISSVGAYFSDTQIVKISNGYLNYPAQIQNTKGSVLTNKSGWTRISGTFTAKGGERYLLLGNFSSDTTSDTVNVSGNKADIAITYYYIDDVSVTAVNPPSTGIAGETSFGHVQVIPNPVRDRAVLQFANPQAESLMLTIYDVNGQQVRVVRDIRTSPFELDRKGLANGLYFFRLQGAESAVARGKFVLE